MLKSLIPFVRTFFVPSSYLLRTLFDFSSTVLRLLISRTAVEQDSKESRRRYDDASKMDGWSAEEG
ncbi:MAG: hypothetical protein ACOCWM_05555 [Cyclobacteriaceae bacterium]